MRGLGLFLGFEQLWGFLSGLVGLGAYFTNDSTTDRYFTDDAKSNQYFAEDQ